MITSQSKSHLALVAGDKVTQEQVNAHLIKQEQWDADAHAALGLITLSLHLPI